MELNTKLGIPTRHILQPEQAKEKYFPNGKCHEKSCQAKTRTNTHRHTHTHTHRQHRSASVKWQSANDAKRLYRKYFMLQINLNSLKIQSLPNCWTRMLNCCVKNDSRWRRGIEKRESGGTMTDRAENVVCLDNL